MTLSGPLDAATDPCLPSGYTVDDGHGGKIHVNGNLTSGENIGDTGLIQAYRAWKEQFDVSRAANKEYLLPGLNYTRYVRSQAS